MSCGTGMCYSSPPFDFFPDDVPYMHERVAKLIWTTAMCTPERLSGLDEDEVSVACAQEKTAQFWVLHELEVQDIFNLSRIRQQSSITYIQKKSQFYLIEHHVLPIGPHPRLCTFDEIADLCNRPTLPHPLHERIQIWVGRVPQVPVLVLLLVAHELARLEQVERGRVQMSAVHDRVRAREHEPGEMRVRAGGERDGRRAGERARGAGHAWREVRGRNGERERRGGLERGGGTQRRWTGRPKGHRLV
jgi:hypothetical protein